MKYKVIVAFKDLQDSNHQYLVGETYPREGADVSASRIAELASKDNRAGMVLIEGVEDKSEYTRSDIQKMSTLSLKTLAQELGLDSELSGAKLKPLIIEKLGL